MPRLVMFVATGGDYLYLESNLMLMANVDALGGDLHGSADGASTR